MAAIGLNPVPFTDVQVADEFWAPRMRVNREKTLPHNFKTCQDTGRIPNLVLAAKKEKGDYKGYVFNDSDVHKALEGACDVLATNPDPALAKQIDDLIAIIAAAQYPDGYVNSYFTLVAPERRWSNLKDEHELYTAGHLIEAGVAHFQATGKRTLLDVACRFADYIGSVFGPDKRHDVCGHPEIELALIRLYRTTGQQRYLDLAQFFLNERGRPQGRKSYGEYCQDHAPIAQQSEVVGHAVRAMYLYCAATDAAAISGDRAVIDAMRRIWEDLTLRKMYVTGGVGPSAHNEGFTTAYDLPNRTAYAETCAAIAAAFWNHRLSLLHADARYVDVVERIFYNTMPSGVSLDGVKFFYVNPLASRGDHHRQSWFDCACCPPNILRVFASIGGYGYAFDADGVYVNLYLAGEAKLKVKDTPVTLALKTRYPWEGQIALSVKPAKPATFDLHLRIPGWCDEAALKLNGEKVEKPQITKGYAVLHREWKPGDTVELTLAMPVRRIAANPRVAADIGQVALQRGPIVYCLEAVDNGGSVSQLCLPPDAKFQTEHKPDLLGGVTVVKGTALAVACDDWSGALYRPAAPTRPVEFVAVPYCVWDNRQAGEMTVWLPESPTMVPPGPAKGVTPSASYVRHKESLAALYDRIEPASSADTGVPRFTWWDHKGTDEWVQYDFDAPRRVGSIELYWYDDTATAGQCRLPESWTLLAGGGDEWREVAKGTAPDLRPNQYNRVTFNPLETRGLRLQVKLQKDCSAGILEWTVGPGG